MENKFKRFLSLALAIMMVISMMPNITIGAEAATPTTLYLKPGTNWMKDGARFAAYFFGNGETWVSMTDSNGDDIYEVTVPSGYPKVIFCRMNPNASANNWNNKWNQTGDLTIPTDGKNMFTVANTSWDGATTTWSTYTAPAAPVEHTWTVAGSVSGNDSAAGFFGTAWAPGNTANDMTKNDDGTYTKVYTGVAKGSYEFKVVRDHTWDLSYPGTNYVLNVTPTKATVTITLNGTAVKAVAVCEHDAADYTTDKKAATCTEDGYEKVTCACGKPISTETFTASGHAWLDGYCDECGATCDHKEGDDSGCPTCGYVPPHEHDWSNKDGVCADSNCGEDCPESATHDESVCPVCGFVAPVIPSITYADILKLITVATVPECERVTSYYDKYCQWEVVLTDGVYTCVVTINTAGYAENCLWDHDFLHPECAPHTVSPSVPETVTVTLTWDAENEEWTVAEEDGYIELEIFCAKAADYVLQVGEQKFEASELKAAFTAANNGGTIEVLKDFTLSEYVQIAYMNDVTLNLNGYTITLGNGLGVTVSTVTINAENGGMAVTGTSYLDVGHNASVVLNGGTYGRISVGGAAELHGAHMEEGSFLGGATGKFYEGASLGQMAWTYYSMNGAFGGAATFVLEENCEWVAVGANQVLTKKAAPAVAEINGTKYDTLAEAFAAAKSGDTIMLMSTYVLTEPITINLPGVTIATAEGAYLVVEGDLTIEDVIFNANCGSNANEDATMIVKGGTFNSSLYLTGSVSISGGTFNNSVIAAVGCTDMDITGGTFNNMVIFGYVDTTISGGIFNGSLAGNYGVCSITGGTFKNQLANGYETCIAEGYEQVRNQDGTWSVVVKAPKNYVAQIGETGYETLEAAMAAAQSGDTIMLMSTYVLTEPITINLPGVTIATAEGAYLVVEGDLTIEDVIFNANCGSNANEDATMIVKGGTFNSSLYLTGSVSISGGTFNNSVIAAVGCTDMDITGGTFNNMVIFGYVDTTISGGIFNSSLAGNYGVCSITGGTFKNQLANGYETCIAEGYEQVRNQDGTWSVVVKAPALPTATVTEIKNNDLTFAMNFKADDATDAQLAYYGNWYADFELTVNKNVTLNANGGANGYLSGQYDGWSENWVNVPFENVTLTAGQSLKIMEYASELMGKPGLKYTCGEVYEFVKDFNCGVFFEPEFLKANPDLEVTLELRMYNPADETDSYVIGRTYVFSIPALPTATVTEIKNNDLTFAMNFKADDATDAQLAYYGNWYADFELTVNKNVTLNANGGANGYLSGQYDGWSENWVNVPLEDVTLTAGQSLKIMEYASELMGKPGLKYTYGEVYEFVKDFNCGVFFEPEFLKANPDLEVTLELRMYNPADETDSYVIGRTYVFSIPALPTATVTEIKNNDLTFAMNFKADDATDAQLAYYGNWYADFELTVNKNVTLNANGGANGYLSGQYDGWSENWVNVPLEDVTLTAGQSLKIMEYASELMGKPGLKYTYGEVYEFVKDFNCGVFFEPEFLKANPDLEVTLELRMYNPADETDSYVIGRTYVFKIEDTKFDFVGTNLILGNNLDLMFAFQSSHVDDWTGYYAKMVRTYGDGSADHVVTIPSSEWGKSGSFKVVTYYGFAAKEMCDDITVTIYDPNGVAVSVSKTDSIQAYAMRAYKDDPAAATVVVDLLNYGAAAQQRFEYCADIELANDVLTDADQQHASELKAITDIQEIDKAKVGGANVIIKSNIEFQIAFKNITEGMYAKVEYTNHKGKKVEETHTYADMTANGNFRVVSIKSMVVADSRCKVTVTMYNADGSEYTKYVDSIASYALRGMKDSGWGVFEAFMKFTDSAHAYLHRNDKN